MRNTYTQDQEYTFVIPLTKCGRRTCKIAHTEARMIGERSEPPTRGEFESEAV